MEAAQQNGKLSAYSPSQCHQASTQIYETRPVIANTGDSCKTILNPSAIAATPTIPTTPKSPSLIRTSPSNAPNSSSRSPSPKSVKTKRKPKNIKPRPVCTVCGKSFSKLANLRAHERIHTGEKRYECIVCFRKFVWKTSLNFHHRNSHKVFFEPMCDTKGLDDSCKKEFRIEDRSSTTPMIEESSMSSSSGYNAQYFSDISFSDVKNEFNHVDELGYQFSTPFSTTCHTSTTHTTGCKAPHSDPQPFLPYAVREDLTMKPSLPLQIPLPVHALSPTSLPIPYSPTSNNSSNSSKDSGCEDIDFHFHGDLRKLPVAINHQQEQKEDQTITNPFCINPEHNVEIQIDHSQQWNRENEYDSQPIPDVPSDLVQNHLNYESMYLSFTAPGEEAGQADQSSVDRDLLSPISSSKTFPDESRNHIFDMLCEQSKVPIIKKALTFELETIRSETFNNNENVENSTRLNDDWQHLNEEHVQVNTPAFVETSLYSGLNNSNYSSPTYSDINSNINYLTNNISNNNDYTTFPSGIKIVKNEKEKFDLLSLSQMTVDSPEAEDNIFERIDTNFSEEVSKEELSFFDNLLSLSHHLV